MDRYLLGIKNSRHYILTEIYNNNYPPIRNFVLQNNGTLEDAQDVFQNVMISLFRKLQKKDIEIMTSFNTYIFTIGKYVWFKKLRKTQRTYELAGYEMAMDLNEELIEEAKYKLFRKHFDLLSDNCKMVLDYYFQKRSFDDIAALMEYKSNEFARRKKYLCKNQLIKNIRKDAGYTDIY